MGGLNIAGPDIGGQAIVGVIGQAGKILEAVVIHWNDGKNRAEYLISDDRHVPMRIREHCRLNEITAIPQPLAAVYDHGAALSTGLDVSQHPLQLGIRDEWSQVIDRIEARPDLQALSFDGEPGKNLILHLRMHEQARPGDADLARIRENAPGYAWNRLVQVGIGQNDDR